MSGFSSGEHDRMIAAMLMPCVVVGVDLAAAAVRVSNGEWTSAWVKSRVGSRGERQYTRSSGVLIRQLLTK